MLIQSTDALIVVDVQKDFCPGGRLAVPNGDEVVQPLNSYIKMFRSAGGLIFYTYDWHPKGHCSFNEQGGPWPTHCVQGTEGAASHPQLIIDDSDCTFFMYKGTLQDKEEYSGFSSVLEMILKRCGTKRMFVGGLATEYCVKATALDAVKMLPTYILTRCIRAVNVQPDDGRRALNKMITNGMSLVGVWE